MAASLSISLVIHHPDEEALFKTIQSLVIAGFKAQFGELINDFFLTIVDNSEYEFQIEPLLTRLDDLPGFTEWRNNSLFIYKSANLGYGAGHNFAIREHCEAYHLVINPDVLVHPDALLNCIMYSQQYVNVGLITPFCQGPDGQQEYLCKNYPSLWILLLRGFAPSAIKKMCQAQLAHYELRSQQTQARQDILIASGCFMFFRREALQAVAGFCESFFLYFEDFDLSLRLSKQWQIAYVPTVKITHYGGHSAKKGFWHIQLFVKSALLFFRRHGWRFW